MANKSNSNDVVKKVTASSNIGELGFGYREYRQVKGRQLVVCPLKPNVVDVIPHGSELFDMVYSVNPRTKLPDGDIVMFMSENTSPDVRLFIQQNLMKPYSDSDGGKYDGLDDDAIAMYTRNQNESVQDYRDRMYQVVLKDYQARKASAKKDE